MVSGAGAHWLGGLNYFRNLLRALALDQQWIEPVSIAAPNASVPTELVFRHTLRTRLVEPRTAAWGARMLLRQALGTDLLLSAALRKAGVSLLSHTSGLGRRLAVPSLAWIPDFQHRRLPHLFRHDELRGRDRAFREISERASLIVVSSECALKDLAEFYPWAASRGRVLRFVDSSSAEVEPLSAERLRERYGLPNGPFFLLPNQFWTHKNHLTVISALRVLRERGQAVTVIATGNTRDAREPNHFDALMAECRAAGVDDWFRVLGIVPYQDLASLMRCAVAVVNPSLFEGWSTSVEEAKTLGRTVILSDIPVHREQAPLRGRYFRALDPEQLAEVMWSVRQEHDPATEQAALERALDALPERRRAFAREYAEIAWEAVGD